MAIKLIDIKEISGTLYPLEISNTDYITKNIHIYRKYPNNKFYEISKHINKSCGYLYASIKFKDGKIRKRRVHRLIAQTFIPNPDPINFPIVGHKNNIKTDDRIENLYWTTTQENTQKAVDDALLVNLKGVENKNAQPVQVLDLNNNFISAYGSIRETSRFIKNLTASYISKTIRDISNNYNPRNKKYKYFFITKEEFYNLNEEFKYKHLVEEAPTNKKPKVFEAINIKTNERIISDNQKKFAKEHNLYQPRISFALLHPNENIDTGNWKFRFIQEKEYIDGSGYENLINLTPSIYLENIHTKEKLEFKTIIEMKEYFRLKGHGSSYCNKNALILNQWKMVDTL